MAWALCWWNAFAPIWRLDFGGRAEVSGGFWAWTNGNYGNIKWGTPELILFVFGAMKRLDASVLVETIAVSRLQQMNAGETSPLDLYYT